MTAPASSMAEAARDKGRERPLLRARFTMDGRTLVVCWTNGVDIPDGMGM
jgi:hypothetical protein